MKNPANLTHEELVEIATGLQQILYGREHEDGRWSYQVDKQWSGADVCEAAAELLSRFDLVPDSEGDGEPVDGQ
jgi:hypothetical protein